MWFLVGSIRVMAGGEHYSTIALLMGEMRGSDPAD